MSEHLQFKDHYNEARIFFRRCMLIALLMTTLIGILLLRFYSLQVVQHQDYVTQSDRNRVQVQAIPPTRGLVYDRNGALLAENRASYTLSLVKERVDDVEARLALLAELVSISEEDIVKFRKRMSQRRRPYEAVPLRFRLNEEEIAKLAVNEYRLAGVEVEAQLVRNYPFGELFAHSVGYVGRINEREQSQFTEEEDRLYSGTHSVGKIGLERQYESILLGQVGSQQVETNARGRVLRVLQRDDPEPGSDLQLYLDVDIQRKALEVMAGRRGAVVAIEVKTGGILAILSTPSFDPNLFVTGISVKDYGALNQSRDLPLFNRTIQGQYPPGSTVKPMLALGGLQAGLIDEHYSVRDPGFYQLEGEERKYRDWKRRGHGHRVALNQSIMQSCDVYYYDLAFRMGIDRMHNFGARFGLGSKTGIDIPSERGGLWPSRRWKKNLYNLPWFPGDSINMGIGQGFVLTTPLQLASMTAILAARGKVIPPRLVRAIDGIDVEREPGTTVDASEGNWDLVTKAMEDVIHGPRGTAARIRRKAKFRMAGKTGTAQVVGMAQDAEYDSEALAERQRDHALFVGYAPAEDPTIAVAVIVENGESSKEAALIARALFDQYILHSDKPSTEAQ